MDLSGITPPRMDWDSWNIPGAWEKFHRHISRPTKVQRGRGKDCLLMKGR